MNPKKLKNEGAIVDIKVFIRDLSTGLEPYILNRGGKVSDIFKELVNENPQYLVTPLNRIDAELLKTYGPGLFEFDLLNETLVFGMNETLVYKGIPTGQCL